MNKKILIMTVLSTLMTACASQQPYGYGNYGYNDSYNGYDPDNRNRRVSSALIGGGVGAVTGAALGTAFGGDDLANAGLGALAGGAVGAAVGAYVDEQQDREAQRQQYGYQQTPYYDGDYR